MQAFQVSLREWFLLTAIAGLSTCLGVDRWKATKYPVNKWDQPAMPIRQTIDTDGMLRDSPRDFRAVAKDYCGKGHPPLLIDADGYVWVEAGVTDYNCRDCHNDRWNGSGGYASYPTRLYYSDHFTTGTTRILPEKP